MPESLSRVPVQAIKGVGEKKAALLSTLGINSAKDVLYYLPFRYQDMGELRKISELQPGTSAIVRAEVLSANLRTTLRARKKIFELLVTDGTGRLKCKWFNQPFLKNRFRKGQRVLLSGAVQYNFFEKSIEMESPAYETLLQQGEKAGRVLPAYKLTEGLSGKVMRNIVREALREYLPQMEEFMPEDILERNSLPGLKESILRIHGPGEKADISELNAFRSPWQKRVFFDELFLLSLGMSLRARDEERLAALPVKPDGDLLKRFLARLPFKLTAGQEKAVEEITRDMSQGHPMKRLLQGDVGSGKTVVAISAIVHAVEQGFQAALMAPTEILAGQHFMNIHAWLNELGIRAALLTSGTKKKSSLYRDIASGQVQVAIGTHALISEAVRFKNLALAVIDEQHRFGVMQRAALFAKAEKEGPCPHLLVMTATPIPRTLALSIYGDLDISTIYELPGGRTPVKTELHYEGEKGKVYEAISRELEAGGQVYAVYPVIEGPEKESLRSVVKGFEGFRQKFPRARVALLHGRMPEDEREAVMRAMRGGEIDILVSTTVIEVGVDVPGATLMLIVHAERFGLSQLHQLRGRVGRGSRPSKCLLLAYPPLTEEAARRLRAMLATTDGFRIAEEDFLIRGPGEFLGTKQSGLPELMRADLIRDRELFLAARKEASEFIKRGRHLSASAALAREMEEFWAGKAMALKGG